LPKLANHLSEAADPRATAPTARQDAPGASADRGAAQSWLIAISTDLGATSAP
jgi:hypothetical protein